MRSLLLVVASLLPIISYAQETRDLARRASPVELAKANDLLKANDNKVTSLKYGGYALIRIKIVGELTPYVVPGSDDCIKTQVVTKGQIHASFKVRNDGDGSFQWIEVPPDTEYDRLLVQGSANGTATVLWLSVENGKPVVVDGFKFLVGKPKPGPVDPDVPVDPVNPTDPLVVAAQNDIKANKGTKSDLDAYASLFLMYGTEIKNGSRFVTAADLNKEMNAKIDQLLGEDHVTLDTLRTAVGKELLAKVPTLATANTKIADVKTPLSNVLLDIYKRLGK